MNCIENNKKSIAIGWQSYRTLFICKKNEKPNIQYTVYYTQYRVPTNGKKKLKRRGRRERREKKELK